MMSETASQANMKFSKEFRGILEARRSQWTKRTQSGSSMTHTDRPGRQIHENRLSQTVRYMNGTQAPSRNEMNAPTAAVR